MAESLGRYIYGVAVGGTSVKFGPIGVDNGEVYAIPFQELCAIVHACDAAPYNSDDQDIVKGWVKTHQNVLDKAKERFVTVIPLGFDTILRSKDYAVHPDQVVQDWLEKDYERLCALVERVKGKDEYGVQVLYEPGTIARQISKESEEIKTLTAEMAAKSSGTAYLYRHKLEKIVKARMEELANDWFKDFYGRIKLHCDDIVIERTKRSEGDKTMILNLSCLVAKEKVARLGDELDKIGKLEGFSVRFSGPWPPYSFVAKPAVPAEEQTK